MQNNVSKTNPFLYGEQADAELEMLKKLKAKSAIQSDDEDE